MNEPNNPGAPSAGIPGSQTEHKAAEREIAGQLALEVMHEIRNPLEALGHLTYLTLNDPHDADKVVKYMHMAEEQMATLNRIVSQTLGLVRATSGSKASDLLELIEAALRIHQRTVSMKKISLVRDIPAGITAEIRMGEILQVVSNLIVNALDALPVAGTLVIKLRKRTRGAHILIADNGHGIAAEHLTSIFEPFFTTKGEHGTGLGLALSRKIIEAHGGKIAVRSSTRTGQSGTIFKISLPAA
jgi:signal transduction histidine kinase